jgi:hypothetical protein
MIADGLWIDRRHRLASPHQPRRRRDCLGELVQIDGSEHAWFETRCLDGRFTVQFEGTPLPFRVFDKIQTVTPAAIVENKRLGAALAMVKEHQATYRKFRRGPRLARASGRLRRNGALATCLAETKNFVRRS